MLVKCIDNTEGYEKILTIGKVYSAEKSDIEGYLNVKGDNGNVEYVYVGRFEIYSEVMKKANKPIGDGITDDTEAIQLLF